MEVKLPEIQKDVIIDSPSKGLLISDEEKIMMDMKDLIVRGFDNPSAITSILFHQGHKGRFMEIRK